MGFSGGAEDGEGKNGPPSQPGAGALCPKKRPSLFMPDEGKPETSCSNKQYLKVVQLSFRMQRIQGTSNNLYSLFSSQFMIKLKIQGQCPGFVVPLAMFGIKLTQSYHIFRLLIPKATRTICSTSCIIKPQDNYRRTGKHHNER